MSLPTIKLLITDLDNTLYDWVGFFAKASRAMVAKAVELLDVEEDVLLDELHQVHVEQHDSERRSSLAQTSSARARWPEADEATRIERLGEAFEAFEAARAQHLKLYEGVEQTLAQIRAAGVPIIGHTETSAAHALERVTHLGLGSHFERLYTTGTTEGLEHPSLQLVAVPEHLHKPDPRILLEICFDYGVDPEQTLYVGDSIARDIGMARQVRINAAWAAYGCRHDPEDWQTMLRVAHWTEEDVDRVSAARDRYGASKPDLTLQGFAELLKHYSFEAPAPKS